MVPPLALLYCIVKELPNALKEACVADNEDNATESGIEVVPPHCPANGRVADNVAPLCATTNDDVTQQQVL